MAQVNAGILTDSGGTCVCTSADPTCMSDPTSASDLEYNLCLGELRRDFITGTAAISALCTVAMGVFANMPIAIAPGMGLNAYFAYTVVGFHGTGPVKYELALTAIFIEGFVFVGLSLLGLRQWLARAIPASIKLASGVGIGLYLSKLEPIFLMMKTNVSSYHRNGLQCWNRSHHWSCFYAARTRWLSPGTSGQGRSLPWSL